MLTPWVRRRREGPEDGQVGGNAVSAVKATEQYGADVLRLYVASMDYADDVRMSEKGIKEMSEAYRKIRNTFRYLLGNLEDYQSFDPATVPLESLHEIDRWALRQLDEVARDVNSAYERFEFYRVFQRIYQFCSVELSSFYLDVLKDRLYAELPRGPARGRPVRAARLHHVLTRLLAPLIPHTAEELWDLIPATPDKVSSVHLADWPEADKPLGAAAESTVPWADLLVCRALILRATEALRKSKKIGSNQEAVGHRLDRLTREGRAAHALSRPASRRSRSLRNSRSSALRRSRTARANVRRPVIRAMSSTSNSGWRSRRSSRRQASANGAGTCARPWGSLPSTLGCAIAALGSCPL